MNHLPLALLLVLSPALSQATESPDPEGDAVANINAATRERQRPIKASPTPTPAATPTPTPTPTLTEAGACTAWCYICLSSKHIDQCVPGAAGFCSPTGDGVIPDCSVVLSEQMCKAFGIPYTSRPRLTAPLSCDATKSCSELPALRDKWKGPPLLPLNFEEIKSACTAAEETQHAIDLCSDPGMRKCDSEQRGDEPNIACLKFYIAHYCKSKPSETPAQDSSIQECRRLRAQLRWQEIQQSINACVCKQNRGAVDCSICLAECQNKCGGNQGCKDLCEQANRGYCEEPLQQDPMVHLAPKKKYPRASCGTPAQSCTARPAASVAKSSK
jgi:hypothetical protein